MKFCLVEPEFPDAMIGDRAVIDIVYHYDQAGALTPARRRRLAAHWLQVLIALALPYPS